MDGQIIAKANMQGIINDIVSGGAVVFINSGTEDIKKIYVDRIDILFAKPYIGSGFSTRLHYYWAVCFEVGFDRFGSHSVHLLKMEMIREYNEERVIFTDQHGNSCVLEATDDSGAPLFRDWFSHKEENPDMFERLYEENRRDAAETIDYWESGF